MTCPGLPESKHITARGALSTGKNKDSDSEKSTLTENSQFPQSWITDCFRIKCSLCMITSRFFPEDVSVIVHWAMVQKQPHFISPQSLHSLSDYPSLTVNKLWAASHGLLYVYWYLCNNLSVFCWLKGKEVNEVLVCMSSERSADECSSRKRQDETPGRRGHEMFWMTTGPTCQHSSAF